jgi:hypothetical protein
VLVVVVLTYIVQFQPGQPGVVEIPADETWPYLNAGDSPPVTRRALEIAFADCLEGPISLNLWDAPRRPGVYAIMHKPDPENHPDAYVIDYCGEGSRLSSYRNYPWLKHRVTRLLSRSGSEDNLYIAYCPMPASDRRIRQELRRTLIGRFDPYFNRHEGA